MNLIHLTRQAEYGFNVPKDYDLAITHLKCYSKDSFLSNDDNETGDLQPPTIACRFCTAPNYENYLALANELGRITIQDTSLNLSSAAYQNIGEIETIRGHHNAIFDLAWSPGSLQLVTVSGDHTAVQWDVATGGAARLTPIHKFYGHKQSVKTVSFCTDDKNLFATGARDGMIMTWDTRLANPNNILPDNSISSCHFPVMSKKLISKKAHLRPDSITSVLYKDQYNIISCAAGDNLIKVWDMRKTYSLYKHDPRPSYVMKQPTGCGKPKLCGFSNLVMDPSRIRLYASCMDHNIYCYDINTYPVEPVATYHGHENMSFYIKSCLSNDGKYLVSGSSDNNAYIWNVKKPGKPIAQVVGHSAEVTCVDWSSKGEAKLVTCSDDACFRIWRLNPEAEPTTGQRRSEDLLGWVEPISYNDSCAQTHNNVTSYQTTPKTLKRDLNNQDCTPDVCSDTPGSSAKRLKEDHRTVLSAYPVNNLHGSDSKGARRLFDFDTSSPTNSGIEILSPTSNLPNYVLDGTSPHHKCTVNRQKENQNWLTKLQVTPPPKNTKDRVTPKRRSSQKISKVCGSLLKFFRVSTKQSPTPSCGMQRELILAEPISTETST